MVHPAPRLDVHALVPGMGLGLLLIGLELLSFALFPKVPDNAFTILSRAVLIYGPPGALIGWRVKRKRAAQDVRLLPAATHALLGCLVLTPLHAFLLLATNAGLAPGVQWFLAEAVLAASMGALAGAVAARVQPAS